MFCDKKENKPFIQSKIRILSRKVGYALEQVSNIACFRTFLVFCCGNALGFPKGIFRFQMDSPKDSVGRATRLTGVNNALLDTCGGCTGRCVCHNIQLGTRNHSAHMDFL